MTGSLNGTPTLDDPLSSIVDDRILTSCAAVCARMDGWWTLAAGNQMSPVYSKTEEIVHAGLH
jgi:hypothetical protein